MNGCAPHRVECARAEDFLRSLPDDSVDLIVTDPPYFRVKALPWDRQWSKPAGFIAWLDGIAAEWARVLRPNGTLYCFAAANPATASGATMAARVEVMLSERFNVIASPVWVKADAQGNGKFSVQHKPGLRAHFPQTERVIACEHYGETPRALRTARELRGWSLAEAARRFGVDSRLIRFWEDGGRDPWKFRARIWSAYEIKVKRRPFDATAGRHHTDVWTYPTVPARKGKHPCEKPREMAEDIVRQSSRPGAVVLDTFCGSGAFLDAAASLGRTAWGCDASEWWAGVARRAVAAHGEVEAPALPSKQAEPVAPEVPQLSLFGAV